MITIENLEIILTVVGAIGIIVGIVRFTWAFFSSSNLWLDDVKIQVEDFDANIDYEEYYSSQKCAIYPEVYKDYEAYDGEEITVNFFIPNNTVIKNLRIKKINPKSIERAKERYKTIKVIREISPEQPLCLIIPRCEAFAQHTLEWKTKYGGKTTYYFYSNNRNGTYNKPGFSYSFGFFARIRKFFGLE